MTLAPAELDALRKYDTPTLANALEQFGISPRGVRHTDPSIRCAFPDLPRFVGYAATATMQAATEPRSRSAKDEGYAQLYAHVREVGTPRVVVVQDLDAPDPRGCLWGEVNATIFGALDCEGVVTNGLVRDLPEARAVGFRYHAAGIGVTHAFVRVEQAAVDVVVGGLAVAPGDLLHGDLHGVLSIPHEVAAELPRAADDVIAREQRLIRWVRSDEFDPDRLADMRVSH